VDVQVRVSRSTTLRSHVVCNCPLFTHASRTHSAINTCRTCSTFGVDCVEIDEFPNATIAEYGTVTGADNMKAEIFARGPIACGVNAEPLIDYDGGVYVDDKISDKGVNHIISVVGWGANDDGSQVRGATS